jgi:hypothetical protein
MFGVTVSAGDLDIVFSRKDFSDMHFILGPCNKQAENPTRTWAVFLMDF